MPRKKNILKNRYCRRSKLTETEFIILVTFYFHEALFGSTRKQHQAMYLIAKSGPTVIRPKEIRVLGKATSIEEAADKNLGPQHIDIPLNDLNSSKWDEIAAFLEEEITPVSEKTINSYFKKINEYIWNKFIVANYPSFDDKRVVNDLLDFLYNKGDTSFVSHELFSGFPFYIDPKNVTRSTVCHLLSGRSKVLRGFKNDTFYLEFSRVFFICAAIDSAQVKTKSIYSVNKEKYLHDIMNSSIQMLLGFLEKDPM